MAEKIRVGVTGNSRFFAPSWWCISMALRLVGATPLRISLRHRLPSITDVDAMIISGGDDINPQHYGGEDLPRARLDPERDEMEIHWIREALGRGMPLLGICRGAQLLNIVLQGTLHQDLRKMRAKTYNRPGLLPTKQVFISENSRLYRLLARRRIRVNSLHHQAIDKPGKGLRIVAKDLDGITQAVEGSDDERIIGVQWHPEYMFYLPTQLRLFRYLVESCRVD